MKASELRGKDVAALEKEVTDLLKAHFGLRMQKATQQLQNHSQLGKTKLWTKPIVTKIEPYKAFYAAEGYHQDFMLNNPKHGYILRWDAPKVAALKTMFPKLYRASFLKDAG